MHFQPSGTQLFWERCCKSYTVQWFVSKDKKQCLCSPVLEQLGWQRFVDDAMCQKVLHVIFIATCCNSWIVKDVHMFWVPVNIRFK